MPKRSSRRSSRRSRRPKRRRSGNVLAAGSTLPLVTLPLRMPRPREITNRDLETKGVRIPFGWVHATEPTTSRKQAHKDGEAAAHAYERRAPYSNHASVVALIRWKDEDLWSAAVAMYRSDT